MPSHTLVYASPTYPSRCTSGCTSGCTTGDLRVYYGCTYGCDTSVRDPKEERHLSAQSAPFSSQNKPPSPRETGAKGQRNPLQRVTPHKEEEKPPTPPKVLSGPLQGELPPFNTF